MVTVPVRALSRPLAATVSTTVPLPLPPVGLGVIHDDAEDAVHEQPVVVVTETLAVPPSAAMLRLVGPTLNEQAGGAASCDTTKPLPAIDAVPDRSEVPVFCVQDTVTDPDPLPLAGDAVSHEPLPDADQLPPVHPFGDPVTATS